MKTHNSIQFKNGNINLRIPREDLEDLKKDQVLYLSELLSWNNCDFIGETYCLNNFETVTQSTTGIWTALIFFPGESWRHWQQGKW